MGASGKTFLGIVCLLLASNLSVIATAAQNQEIKIKMDCFFRPNNPRGAYTRQLINFMRENPKIKIQKWGGIALPGGGRASLMMAIAGKTAPDIGQSWFHIIRNEIKQQFLYPLNEWIGEDTNGNGQIDDSEAKWEGWKKIPPLWRKVVTVKGKVYGIPQPLKYMQGILYRVDMVKAAGLNPNKPPKTWDELLYWCQKLTNPNKIVPGAILQSGQKGICLPSNGYLFLPWIQSAGGKTMIQIKTSPKTGKKYEFPLYETKFITPDGENLSFEKSDWKANFASKAGLEAVNFLYKLRWGKWLIDPTSQEPVSLTSEDVENGFVMLGKRKLEFKPENIIKGTARGRGTQRGEGALELLGRGEVAMTVTGVDDLKNKGASANVDPNLLSWLPYPAAPGPNGQRVVQIQNHYTVMYTGVGERPKVERDAIWKTLLATCEKKIVDNEVTARVLAGLGRFVSPKELERLGYEEYIRDIPQDLRRNFAELESGKIKSFTEPWVGFWYLMDVAINRECLGIMLGAKGEEFDCNTALRDVENKANSGLMFKTPKKILDKWRPYAFTIMILLILIMAFLGYKIIRSYTNELISKVFN